jgi:hypothetical protein
LSATPNGSYTFNQWTGDVGGVANIYASSTTITISANTVVTATFSSPTQYTVQALNNNGGVVVYLNGNGSGQPFSLAGGTYSLSAVASSGYSFTQWTGDVGGVANVYASSTTITISANTVVQANFAAVSVSDQSVYGTVSSGYRLRNDGVALFATNGNYTDISGEWLTSGNVGDFEVLASNKTGDSVSGQFDTWLGLSTTRTWTLSAPINQFRSAQFTISIRNAATQTVLDSATIYLEGDNT